VFQILAQLIELSSPPLSAVSQQLAAAQLGSTGLHTTQQQRDQQKSLVSLLALPGAA
jgi:hypothetical protein